MLCWCHLVSASIRLPDLTKYEAALALRYLSGQHVVLVLILLLLSQIVGLEISSNAWTGVFYSKPLACIVIVAYM